jgi:nitroreductase
MRHIIREISGSLSKTIPAYSIDEPRIRVRHITVRSGLLAMQQLIARQPRDTIWTFFGNATCYPPFHAVRGATMCGWRVAGDMGMYAQTFLLSLVANGLGGIPQTILGGYADIIRDVPGIEQSLKMLFGISFGYPNETAAANHYRIGMAPIEDSVIFHD